MLKSKENKEFLGQLMKTFSPSGVETESLKVFADFLEQRGLEKYYSDKMGNLAYRIGNGKKIITTNKFALDYEFVSPMQVCLVDMNNPVLPLDFIKNNDVGFDCPSGDSEDLANIIKGLELRELKLIGKHSKDVYFKKYSKSIFMNRLISTLESMKK